MHLLSDSFKVLLRFQKEAIRAAEERKVIFFVSLTTLLLGQVIRCDFADFMLYLINLFFGLNASFIGVAVILLLSLNLVIVKDKTWLGYNIFRKLFNLINANARLVDFSDQVVS